MIVSYLGNFGGGLGVLPVWWDVGILAVVSAANFWLADWCRLSFEKAQEYRHRYLNPDVVPPSNKPLRYDLDEPG